MGIVEMMTNLLRLEVRDARIGEGDQVGSKLAASLQISKSPPPQTLELTPPSQIQLSSPATVKPKQFFSSTLSLLHNCWLCFVCLLILQMLCQSKMSSGKRELWFQKIESAWKYDIFLTCIAIGRQVIHTYIQWILSMKIHLGCIENQFWKCSKNGLHAQ